MSCMHEHPSVSPSTMPKVSGTCFPWLCKSADLENDVQYCQKKRFPNKLSVIFLTSMFLKFSLLIFTIEVLMIYSEMT